MRADVCDESHSADLTRRRRINIEISLAPATFAHRIWEISEKGLPEAISDPTPPALGERPGHNLVSIDFRGFGEFRILTNSGGAADLHPDAFQFLTSTELTD